MKWVKSKIIGSNKSRTFKDLPHPTNTKIVQFINYILMIFDFEFIQCL